MEGSERSGLVVWKNGNMGMVVKRAVGSGCGDGFDGNERCGSSLVEWIMKGNKISGFGKIEGGSEMGKR